MTVSEWHKIENDGDPWQPTCWLQMAHNDDDDKEVTLSHVGVERWNQSEVWLAGPSLEMTACELSVN